MDIFLLMYLPTPREISIEMSKLYSTQTKEKQLNLSMDELLTFYGILITSGYSSEEEDTWSGHLTVMYTMKAFQMQRGEIALTK